MQLSVANAPFVTLAALWTPGQDALVTDPQQRLKLALDPNIDRFAGRRTSKVQAFHCALTAHAGFSTREGTTSSTRQHDSQHRSGALNNVFLQG